KTLASFEKWIEEAKEIVPTLELDVESVRKLYKRVKENDLPFVVQHENLLATDPSLNSYEQYIQGEMERKNPTRVCFIFERAITEHCLHADLWLKYLKYIEQLSLPHTQTTYARAVRNCPF